MAVEKIVIEVAGEAKMQSTIDQLVKVGVIDAKNAEQFKKNNQQFTAETQKNIEKVLILQKSVEQLQYALTRAQNPKQVEILNRALAEQSQRLMSAALAAKDLQYQIDRTAIAEAKLAVEAKKANELLIVEQRKAAQQAETLVQKLIRLGVIEEKNAEQFRKNANNLTAKSQQNISKVVMLQKSVDQLGYALAKAENPAQVRALNIALAEQNRRLISATAAAKQLEYQTQKQTSPAVGFLKNQFAAVGATIAGAFAVTQLISFGKEAINLAAKGEGIRRAFAALNKADLLDNLRAATRNTVADIDLMAAAVKANNFKIPLEDLARYFKFAQQRARETGESVDYLVESIVLGIGRKSPLILDNLGISAVELRSKLKGIGTESASVAQISQAVGQIIDEELSKQGVLLDTTADKLARLDAGWKNIKEAFGITVIDGLNPLYDSLEKTNTEIDRLKVNFGGASEEGGKFNVVSFVLKNIVNGIGEPIRIINERLQDMIDIFNRGSENFRKIGVWLGLTDEKIRDLLPGVKDLNQSIGNDFEDATEKSIAAQVKLLKTERELSERQYEAGISTEWLKQRLKDYAEEADKLAIGSKERNRIIANMILLQGVLDKAFGKTTDKIKEQNKALSEQQMYENKMSLLQQFISEEEAAKQAAVDAEKKLFDQSIQNEMDANDAKTKAYKDWADKMQKIFVDYAKKEKDTKVEWALKTEDEKNAIINQYAQDAAQIAIGLSTIIGNLEQQQTNEFIKELDRKKEAGEISDEEYTKLRKDFLRKQAQDQRDLAIFQATVNAALAVINAITTGDPYTIGIRAAIAAAIGIAEVAAIGSQPLPTFGKGGKVKGKSHREGGVHAELEGDEFVISRKAAHKIGFDNLEMLNKGIVPVKLLRQSMSDTRNKNFETNMMKVFGSSDFDTYNIEKLLKKGISNERDMTHLLIQELRGSQRKRGIN